jgi:hypothetical protein
MYEAPDDERDAAGQLAPLEQNGDRAVNWMTGGDDGSRERTTTAHASASGMGR